MRMDCIRRHSGKCGGRTTCPFRTFLERAVYCHDFVPDDHDPCIRTSMMEREAAWADVKAKGEAIVAAGGVEILEDNPAYVEALVMSGDVAGSFPVYDGGPYRVILSKKSWENKSNVGGWIQGYLCECFVPGTLITMSDGSVKPIEDIEEGDMVLSGEGISRRVSHTMNRHHVGNVRKIKLHGFAETITCTDNHPFWAIEKIRCDRCESHDIHPYNCKNTHSGKTPPRWIKSCELKPGMYIQLRKSEEMNEHIVFDMSRYCDDFVDVDDGYIQPISHIRRTKNGKVQEFDARVGYQVKRFVKFDSEIAYVFGLYLGDGNLHAGNEINWSFGSKEEHLANAVAEILSSRFGVNVRKRKLTNDAGKHNMWHVSVYSKQLCGLFAEMLGEYSHRKRISNSIMRCEPSVLHGILEGWDDSDACHSINREMVSQMQQIAIANGVLNSIRVPKASGKNNSALVPCEHTRQMHQLYINPNAKIRTAKRVIDGEGEWVRIESIDDFDYDGQVFNLEVENDHTYLANGFKVHNCKWGSYHSGEPGPGYQGRFCSHAYAAMMVTDMRAKKDFMNDRRASMTTWGNCAECGEHDLVSLTTGLCDRCGEKTVFTSMAKAMFGTASQRQAAEEELTKADDSVIEDIEDNMEVEERGDISIARWHGHQAIFSRCASSKVAWQDETLYEVAVSANGIDTVGSVRMTEFGHLYAYWNGKGEEFTEQPDWNPANRHDEIDAAVDWVMSQANEFAETISEFDPKITVTKDDRYALDRFGSVDSPTPVYDAQQGCYIYRDYYYIYEPDGEDGWRVDYGGELISPIDDSLEGCIEVCDEIIESEYGSMDEFVRRESMRGKFADHRLDGMDIYPIDLEDMAHQGGSAGVLDAYLYQYEGGQVLEISYDDAGGTGWRWGLSEIAGSDSYLAMDVDYPEFNGGFDSPQQALRHFNDFATPDSYSSFEAGKASKKLAYKEGDTFADEDGNVFSITKVTFEGEIEGEDFFEYDVIDQDGEALTFTNTDLDYMRKIGNRKTATRQFTYAEMQELEDEVKGKPYLNNADRLKEPDTCMFY